jgi:hypothetical protein
MGVKLGSSILREERGLRLFDNRVLRRIFGPKRDEVTREWRRLHKEELNDLYSSPNIIRVIFEVASFPQISPPKSCMHLFCLPYVPYAPPISLFLI